MKKNYKRIFGYAIILGVCALLMVGFACLSENRMDDFEEQYQKDMTLSQKQILSLEEQIENLEKENSKLKEELKTTESFGSDLVTSQQVISDLKEIYEKYKAGDVKSAKAALKKIEPMGFDDASLAYYQILVDIILIICTQLCCCISIFREQVDIDFLFRHFSIVRINKIPQFIKLCYFRLVA